MRISHSLNLAALKHAQTKVKNRNGDMVDAIVIPLEANSLELHTNGAIYLNQISFEMKNVKDYATHITKQNLPKEARETMSDDEKNAMPILGNLKAEVNTPQASVNVDTSIEAGSIEITVDGDEPPF